MSLSEPVVAALQDVRFDYPGQTVLAELDLELIRGECFGLLGPNGAGKSTLIKLLCGRLQPASGQILVNGQNPKLSAAARRSMGLVPQQVALYRHLSVLENLIAFAQLSGCRRSAARSAAKQTIRRCGLTSVAQRPVHELSGGWQRRANIACGVVHAPSLLVLDEPTVGVDLPARLEIEHLLAEMASNGMTILLISHDLDQVERLADRVGFLVRGAIEPIGSPAELLKRFFSGRFEWRVMLDQAPEAGVQQLLTDLGLEADPAAGPMHWLGAVHSDQQASQRMRKLEHVAVKEWRVRQPGLDALWRALFDQPGPGMNQPDVSGSSA